MVASIVRTGAGVTKLNGTIDLTIDSLNLSSTTGTVTLDANGTLKGPGSVNTSGGAMLDNLGGTWNNITINGTAALNQNTTRVPGGVTLNGTLLGAGGSLGAVNGSNLNVIATDGARLSNATIIGKVTVADANSTLWVDTRLSTATIVWRAARGSRGDC